VRASRARLAVIAARSDFDQVEGPSHQKRVGRIDDVLACGAVVEMRA
jgi:hypothetical protein